MLDYFAESAPQSWIELETLLHDYPLGLVVIAGGSEHAGSRPVQWAHSSDLTDPTPFLTPRTVLLTTGGQFHGQLDDETADAYVARLARAGTAALGIAAGLRWDRIPPPLIAACERHELPLIRVPYDTPFIAITRAVSRLIDSSIHAQNLDRLSSPYRSPATSIAQSVEAIRSAVAKLLVSGQRDLAEQVAEPVLPRLPRGQVSVAVLHASDSGVVGLRGSARRRTIQTPPFGEGVLVARLGDRAVIITEPEHLESVRAVVENHAVGLSERGALSDLEELLTQADRALEHAMAASEASGAPQGIVEYRPEMHSGVLQLLADSPDARRRAASLLSPLRSHDERHNDRIERSIEVWLRHNGGLAAAADELQIHRHTLRSRIRLASTLLQRDMRSPDTRAELWTALSIVRGQET